MTSKLTTEDEAVAELSSGMTIGIGGWGSRRKPMSLVRAILRSDLTDLTVVSYGGPDIGLLCAAGKVAHTVSPFVSPDVVLYQDPPLDVPSLEPHYRKARQSGAITETPVDEGMLLLGLQAAAWRVPFLPTRIGLGTDLLTDHPDLRTVISPYDDGETLVAAPAITLDAALVHLNRGDARGNGQFLGPDLYMDDLMLEAASTGRRFMSVEQVVETDEFAGLGSFHTMRVSRLMTDGVIEAPNGAHFTSCDPDYDRDDAFQTAYLQSSKSDEAWAEFKTGWLDLSESDYQAKLARQ
ncbi:MAG TPA: CoA-transferase [Acidimicrobiales bacterium]|nr:CoA-transferase [Acidimicrobiales bacterium]